MQILKTVEQLRDFVAANHEDIGFVPTMGALHGGHASLIEKCVAENKTAIVSTFVNPTQFLAGEDFEDYPKNEQNDAKICEELGVHAMFAPEARELYFDTEPLISAPENLASVLEGKTRPGHFDGVGTVVEELFRQVQPDNAYFGDKDFQQLAIIKKLVQKLKLPINIVGMPIFREESGLAMSSRNMRLSPEQRDKAKLIYATLVKANGMFRKSSLSDVKSFVEKTFEDSDFELEYFIIADEETLKEVDKIENGRSYRAFIVVLVDGVRLIDNIHLD